jgi:L-alanine-DL-glutamate epimerase-like enolase superfamily enzyme
VTTIASVEAVPVRVPLRFDLKTALGSHAVSEYGIVIVDTDDGIRGLGEIAVVWHGNAHPLCRLVSERLGPALIGADVFEVTRLHQLAQASVPFSRYSLCAVAALDMALLDIRGKLLDRPAYDLLGGLARERIELSMSLPIGPAGEIVDRARELVEAGFGTLKVKAASASDLEVTHLLRKELGPALKIRIDLNMACSSAKEALALIRDVEPAGVISVEQPLPAHDLAGMRFLREHSPLPIMADESVWGPLDAWQLLHQEAADIVNVYVSESGGPTRMRETMDLCALAGAGVAVGSMPELAIGTAAAAHAAFSAPRLDHPSDVCGHLYYDDDVVAHGLEVKDGQLLPPPGPGLGIELDIEKLGLYRVD